MTIQYQAQLVTVGTENVTTVPVVGISLREEYINGWDGTALLVSRSEHPLTVSDMMNTVLASNVLPGQAMALRVLTPAPEEAQEEEEDSSTTTTDDTTTATGDAAGAGGDSEPEEEEGEPEPLIVRTWPSIISRIEPFENGEDPRSAACAVDVVDPITYLSDRPIWGAYRAQSIGEMVGGALSLAAGGNGKPTLTPLLPDMPTVEIEEDFRDSLNLIPYSIASGQPLGEWLGDVLGMLGLQLELWGQTTDNSLRVRLTDRGASDDRPMDLKVSTQGVGVDLAEPSTQNSGTIRITGFAGYPGVTQRGGIIDDPNQGAFRYLAPSRSIGTVIQASGVGLDEAFVQTRLPVRGAHSEMLLLSTISRQPGFRPGRIVQFTNVSVQGSTRWQLTRVAHSLVGGTYDNDATLIRADLPWHPPPPPSRKPVFVPGIVHGGDDLAYHEPVPRDRLGSIPVMFPFLPLPGQEEEEEGAGGSGSGSTGSGLDAEVAAQQWPPRLPLTIVEPMAGGAHGFVPSHRQGDICRVAVYGPFYAEIVGFQYRGDRQLNPVAATASAGLLVEHNLQDAWSGLMFRPIVEREEGEEEHVPHYLAKEARDDVIDPELQKKREEQRKKEEEEERQRQMEQMVGWLQGLGRR